MKRKYLKLLPVLFIGVALTFGCAKKVVKEDIASNAAPEAKQETAVAVPDEKPAAEVKSEDLGAKEASQETPKTGESKYASLSPGDELTKQAEKEGELYIVHFDYDKYNIRDEDKDLLNKNAKWLNLNSKVKVVVEGHADERGEAEYNLALGDKRAKIVVKFLESLGISKDRLSTVSYGKEKPLDPGHSESAWAKNRRAEFKITN